MPLTAEDIALRRSGLSSSDIVTLAGVVPFKKRRTPHDVWLEKCAPELVQPTEVTEAMELGHECEPVIVARAARLERLAVVYPRRTVRHATIEWARATPDADLLGPTPPSGAIVDGREYDALPGGVSGRPEGLMECKLVGLHMQSQWDEGVPDYVLTQVAWQLVVVPRDYVLVCALIGTELRRHRVENDADMKELGRALVEVGERFWTDHVLTKRPPPADGSEGAARMLKGLFKRTEGPALQANEEAERCARDYFGAKRAIEDAERAKETAKQRLIEIAGETGAIRGDGWRSRWLDVSAYDVPARHVEADTRFDIRRRGRGGGGT